ncbi:hypothetical protein CICLE_v10026902mg [Citrus x clementina]|uniref:Uncharacterized protein n=1 Tax=Citrus clementina TaxID=85681 RepID=V4UJJ7_CITCL|nr:hypothetical protein CICLE_v10026902mg [Citrus x clementina]
MRETCYQQSLQHSYQKNIYFYESNLFEGIRGKLTEYVAQVTAQIDNFCRHFIKNSTRLSITSSNHHSN